MYNDFETISGKHFLKKLFTRQADRNIPKIWEIFC